MATNDVDSTTEQEAFAWGEPQAVKPRRRRRGAAPNWPTTDTCRQYGHWLKRDTGWHDVNGRHWLARCERCKLAIHLDNDAWEAYWDVRSQNKYDFDPHALYFSET